jgi:hypothetical protein
VMCFKSSCRIWLGETFWRCHKSIIGLLIKVARERERERERERGDFCLFSPAISARTVRPSALSPLSLLPSGAACFSQRHVGWIAVYGCAPSTQGIVCCVVWCVACCGLNCGLWMCSINARFCFMGDVIMSGAETEVTIFTISPHSSSNRASLRRACVTLQRCCFPRLCSCCNEWSSSFIFFVCVLSSFGGVCTDVQTRPWPTWGRRPSWCRWQRQEV